MRITVAAPRGVQGLRVRKHGQVNKVAPWKNHTHSSGTGRGIRLVSSSRLLGSGRHATSVRGPNPGLIVVLSQVRRCARDGRALGCAYMLDEVSRASGSEESSSDGAEALEPTILAWTQR